MGMQGTIIAAIITAMGAIVAASVPFVVRARQRLQMIEETATSVRKLAEKIDHSVNQRPSTLSDRLDMVQATVTSVRDMQHQHTQALAASDAQDAALAAEQHRQRQAQAQIRREVHHVSDKLDEHIADSQGVVSRIRQRIAPPVEEPGGDASW